MFALDTSYASRFVARYDDDEDNPDYDDFEEDEEYDEDEEYEEYDEMEDDYDGDEEPRRGRRNEWD
jgi:hypothetical protein